MDIYVYSLSIRFFSHIGYYGVLSQVPCAAEQVLISYYFKYSSVYIVFYLSVSVSQFTLPLPSLKVIFRSH